MALGRSRPRARRGYARRGNDAAEASGQASEGHAKPPSLQPHAVTQVHFAGPASAVAKACSALATSATWANPALCTEADPAAGAAPPDTLRLCRRLAEALETEASGASAAALAVVRHFFGSEAAPASRLCDVLETEVLCVLVRGQPSDDEAIRSAVWLLHRLASLLPADECLPVSAYAVPHLSLKAVMVPRLLEYLIAGTESAFQEGWVVVQDRLLPIHELAFSSSVLRCLPGGFVALMSCRLRGLVPLEDDAPDEVVRAVEPSVECLYSIGCLAQEIADHIWERGQDTYAEDVVRMLRIQHNVGQYMATRSRSRAKAPPLGPADDGLGSSRGEGGAPPLGSRSPSPLPPASEEAVQEQAPPERTLAAAQQHREGGQDVLAEIAGTAVGRATPRLNDFVQMIAELAGVDVAALVPKLARMARDKVQRLLEGGSAGAALDAQAVDAAASGLHVAASLLGAALAIAGVAPVGSEVAKLLLEGVLEGAALPQELRPHARPLMDLLLGPLLIHHTAPELWALVQATCSHAPGGPPPPATWTFAAGCIAVEIEDALDRGVGAGDPRISETRQVARCLWLAVRIHITWLQHEVPLEVLGREAAPTDEPAPSSAPSAAAAAADSASAAAGGSEGEESEDVGSTSEPSVSPNDQASDLEDFVDFAPENNCHGLLKRILPEGGASASACAAGRGWPEARGALDPSRPYCVREFFRTAHIVPDWQAQCKRLLERFPLEEPPGKEEGAVSPSPRKRRRVASGD